MSVAIYVRVSTDDQSERKTIESQIEFATKYCDLHELSIFRIYKDDGITGTLSLQDRPAGSELLQDAKNGLYDTCLVYKLDRLGRATRVILNAIHDLEAYGVKLKSMTEPFDTGDASGRFLLTILAGVADLERSNILERMWHGSNRAAREGKWLGGIVPYGYKKNQDKMLEINEDHLPNLDMSEADVIRLLYRLVVTEKMTTAKIADYLNALSVPPSYVARSSPESGRRRNNTAGMWLPGRIRNIIRSTTYMGLHQYGKRTSKTREVIERPVPAIIDEKTWNEAQSIITGNLIFSVRNAKHVYLLRNLIQCGNCGYNYHGTVSKDASYYLCNGRSAWRAKNKAKCFGRSINMQWLDDLVWSDCLHYINQPEDALKDIDKKETASQATDQLNQEKNLLKKNLVQKDIEKESILDLYRKNLITSDDVEKQLEKIKEETNLIKVHLKNLETRICDHANVFSARDTAQQLLDELRKKINSTADMTVEFKREIIMTLVDKIVIYTYFDDDDSNHHKPKADISIYYKFSSGQVTKVNNRTDKDSYWRSA